MGDNHVPARTHRFLKCDGNLPSEPLPDEIDREDQMLEAKFASSPARDVEKAIFGAP